MRRVVTLLLLVACGGPEPVEVEPPPPLSTRVAWTSVAPAERIVVTTLPAEVSTLPGGSFAVGPTAAGRIVAWRVRPGEEVRAGQPLAELASPELAALSARAADLAEATRRARQLVEERRLAVDAGVSTVLELSAAQVAAANAEAEEAAAREALAGHAGGAMTSGGHWVWLAPAAGAVSTITCGLDVVHPGDTCITLVDPRAAALRVDVPERHLDVLRGRVEAVFTAADGQTTRFVEVSRAPNVDAKSRALRFLFVPEQGEPLVGSSGRADLVADAPPGGVLVPEAAITRVEGRVSVLVRDGDLGTPTPVERIGRSGDDVAVRGLPADAVVATKGVFLLKSLAVLAEEE
jgi:multidrug efflux pump subunit AcrA (membrane-fusion protein)